MDASSGQNEVKTCFTALHATMDIDTSMLLEVRVRARPGGDVKELICFLKRVVHRCLETVYGDKAYISRQNVPHIHDLRAYLGIEQRRWKAQSLGYRVYMELIRKFRRGPEEWKRVHQYGTRSLVEAVFGMMKVRFGGGLNSRGCKEQQREVLLKVVLHNIERSNFLECTGRRLFIRS